MCTRSYIRTYCINNVKQNNILSTITRKYEEKFKGTIVEKWVTYWKNLYIDYREVSIDLIKGSKEKPWKTIGILSGLTFLGYCVKTNPNNVSFRDAVLRSMNDVLLVNPNLQRKETVQHLRFLEQCHNNNILRRLNLGVLSIMWCDNNSTVCNTFESNCSYLKVPYLEFHTRIIDIGFLNRWWLLEEQMENYDVNY